MTGLRRVLAAGCAAAAVAGLLVAAPAASASAGPYASWAGRDPAHNIAPRPSPYASARCLRPRSRGCSRVILEALDHARLRLGKRSYHLPGRFLALKPAEQLLVLSNSDRHSYGLPLIRGLNKALDASAAYGARHHRDPDFVTSVARHHMRMGTSNWAGGLGPIENPIFAYYEWMYDDGPGSANADCRSAGDPGCWGHRHSTLQRFGRDQVLMGAAGGHDSTTEQTWTELYESFPARASMPLVPTVTGLSRYSGGTSGGTAVRVHGYGFFHVRAVRVLGRAARFDRKSFTLLTIRTPRHRAASGHVVVYGNGGTSRKTGATVYRYRR